MLDHMTSRHQDPVIVAAVTSSRPRDPCNMTGDAGLVTSSCVMDAICVFKVCAGGAGSRKGLCVLLSRVLPGYMQTGGQCNLCCHICHLFPGGNATVPIFCCSITAIVLHFCKACGA